MNGLYVPAATCMIEATSSATSVAVATSDALRATAGRRATANRAASAGTHGVEPTAPAASASHTSDVRYHRTAHGVGAARPRPAIAFRNADAISTFFARPTTNRRTPYAKSSSVTTRRASWSAVGR